MAEDDKQEILGSEWKSGNFICGVVEGFYGRPWAPEQRKDLFQKMKKWGMDSYLYAPKDDFKHRMLWRELYSVEEAEHLTSLVSAAREQGIVFYYALSPGLDITYSSAKDVACLKRKLEQVSQFGCQAFALLFDDIEPEMSEADKEIFQSFAHAQVSVTNEIFQNLSHPKFLLCPTQYCAARALPDVRNSEYLNTIGAKLAPEIDIMWTGPKVISRVLSIESIEEITEVLHRPPVIWDNLHANDYDQKRVFLGPYSGRSPDLMRKLRGVLTNPNCEYGANFVAIHTLAQWSRCSVDGKRDLSTNDAVTADIKLETETEDGGVEDVPSTLSPSMYHPRRALRNAIEEWLAEFKRPRAAWGPLAKPQAVAGLPGGVGAPSAVGPPIMPSVNTCMSVTTTTTSTATGCGQQTGGSPTQLHALAHVCSTVAPDSVMHPTPVTMMNSLLSENKVVCTEVVLVPGGVSGSSAEPMDCNPTPEFSPAHRPPTPEFSPAHHNSLFDAVKAAAATEDVAMADNASVCSTSTPTSLLNMQVESVIGSNHMQVESPVHQDPPASQNECLPSSQRMQLEGTANPEGSLSEEPCISDSLPSSQMLMEQESLVSSQRMQLEGAALLEGPLDEGPCVTDGLPPPSQMLMDQEEEAHPERELTVDDLALLCDLFYLPFEHGTQGVQLLQEFNWLKMNAHLVAPICKLDGTAKKPEVQEWHTRAARLDEMSKALNQLFQRLTYCNNRELLYDLYAYVWDMRGVVSLLNSYVKWLASGKLELKFSSYVQGSYTWFSKGWKEAFMSGEQEPWVFRGGLTADLQRLIPVDSGNDLFIYKAPDVPCSKIYTIRPYLPSDETAVYEVCRRTCDDGMDGTEVFPGIPDLIGDKLIGSYLTLSSEFCFVVEDCDWRVVGYALAALDARQFASRVAAAWVPEMCEKYPKPGSEDTETLSVVKEAILAFHNPKSALSAPDEILTHHPSSLTSAMMTSVLDQSVAKRLITCLLAALRANGSFGVHVEVNSGDKYLQEFYTKLGFTELGMGLTQDTLFLGRTF